MFNPFKKEVIYIDRLAEYRKWKVWEFHMFDKVIVDSIEYQIKEDKERLWKEWIVVDVYVTTEWKSQYYVLFPWSDSPVKIYWTIKPSYWEFQEEFEALEEAQRIQLEVSEKQKRLNELLPKLDKIKDKNFTQLWL